MDAWLKRKAMASLPPNHVFFEILVEPLIRGPIDVKPAPVLRSVPRPREGPLEPFQRPTRYGPLQKRTMRLPIHVRPRGSVFSQG